MARRRLDAEALRAKLLARCSVDLRSSSGLVDARPRRAQPPAHLSRNRSTPGRIRRAAGLYPRRIPAHHGTSVLWFLGIPDDRLLRPNFALWYAAGFHVPGGLSPPARYRRHS